MVVMDIYNSTQSFVSQLCTVFEIRELKLKNNNNNNNKEKMKNCEYATFLWSNFGHILRNPIFLSQVVYIPFRKDGFQIGVHITMETWIFRMYGNNAGQPAPSL